MGGVRVALRSGGRKGRVRKGLSGSAVAAAAMAALTASQSPEVIAGQPDDAREPGAAAAEQPDDALRGGTGDGLPYHTDLPPLDGVEPDTGEDGGGGGRPGPSGPLPEEAGIPATVLDAYRRAEAALAGTRPGCGLDWEVLAAIGKVESGHARGGAVDADGTTTSPILGPVLNGDGFARITDTDGGAWDGDTTFDRAVGPMQFIPSTWAVWGADGNNDGVRDPNNVYDAALAAGEYLCAGDRDLGTEAGLNRALLSYNHSWDYVWTVRAWLDFYRDGAREVPDGQGPLPTSPGPGSPEGRDSGRDTDRTDRDRPRGEDSRGGSSTPPASATGGVSRPGGQEDEQDSGDEERPDPSPADPGEERPGDGDDGGPEEPGQPEEPGEPEEPEEPGNPDEPGDPEEPEEPGGPEEPGDPEEPVDPGEPSDPGDPEEPGQPGAPDCPVEPDDPEDADDPEGLEESEDPEESSPITGESAGEQDAKTPPSAEEPGDGCEDPEEPEQPEEPEEPEPSPEPGLPGATAPGTPAVTRPGG